MAMLEDVLLENDEPLKRYLERMMARESGGNRYAKNPKSSASGPHQFIDSTWLDVAHRYGGKYGLSGLNDRQLLALKTDPDISGKLASEFTQENSRFLAGKLGRAPNEGELYAAHFLGPQGAATLLTASGEADAASMFPEAAKANPTIFYRGGKPRSVADVTAALTSGFGGGTVHSPQDNQPNASYASIGGDIGNAADAAWEWLDRPAKEWDDRLLSAYDSFTIGSGDEVAGYIGGGLEALTGGDFEEGQARTRRGMRRQLDDYYDRAPLEATLMGLTGALPTLGMGAVGMAPKVGALGASALTGMGYGGLYNFNSGGDLEENPYSLSDNPDPLTNRFQAGALGILAGGLGGAAFGLPGAMAGSGRALARNAGGLMRRSGAMRKAGFSPKTWYHGSPQEAVPVNSPSGVRSAKLPFERFDPALSKDVGAAHFGTKGAARWRLRGKDARGGSVTPFVLREGKQIRLPDLGAWSPANVARHLGGPKTNVLTPQEVQAIEEVALRDKTRANQLLRQMLLAKGINTIRYRNSFEGRVRDSIMVLDPDDARSVYAEFSPKHKGTGHLLGGISGLGLLVPAAMVGMGEEAGAMQ